MNTPSQLRDHALQSPLGMPLGLPERFVAIWDNGQTRIEAAPSSSRALYPAMSLVLEFRMPRVAARTPLRLWQGAADPRLAIALYAQRDGAVRLVHGAVDISTQADFARPGEMIGMRYLCCARGRADVLELVNHARDQRFRQRVGAAHAARLDEALPRHRGFLGVCHVAAIADFHVVSTNLPALGAGAPVQTSMGQLPVELLRPDMEVALMDGQVQPLRWIATRTQLCLGQLAPIRLRAPYFGLSHDIIVTPETRVMRGGATVEYLFGHERVLIRAGDLASSPGVTRDRSIAARRMHHLMLDDHACVAIDRCGVETALLSDVVAAEDSATQHNPRLSDSAPCLPVLDRAAAQALVTASARAGGR